MEILIANRYKYVRYSPEEKYPAINISLSSTNGVKKSKYSEKELYYVNLAYSNGKFKCIGWTRNLKEGLKMYYEAFTKEKAAGRKLLEFSPDEEKKEEG